MFYGITPLLPILALNLTQDRASGQDNGPERRKPLDGAEVQYESATGDRCIARWKIQLSLLPG